MRRRVLAVLLAVAALLAGVLAAEATGPAPQPLAGGADLEPAADVSQFDPGNIISDILFYDGSAMSASAVQKFLNAKNPSCTAGAEPCLKKFTERTNTRAATTYCTRYDGAAGETAATIIAKVGQACGISQRALLVMLQKEQGLVSASGSDLTNRRYEIAMGYGCPDTAACDTLYYGFFNQLYSAATQFKRYAANPKNYGKRPYTTNTIYWSPRTSCGTSQVYIDNKATAGLYNYTPYRPNQAALNAPNNGYGLGDSCSAYGNRNFWLYYTDWFGSTQSPGGEAVVALAASAQWKPVLGKALTYVRCDRVDDGCYQRFEGGSIYWSAATGAHVISPDGAVRAKWVRTDKERGRLGYPITSEACDRVEAGCYQRFQGGSIYWSQASGAHVISTEGAVRDTWVEKDKERGALGYPTGDERCGLLDGGCAQAFQGGSLFWSAASGIHLISSGGAVRRAWIDGGKETGALGYPVGDERCGLLDDGCAQAFQGGSLFWSPDTGAHVISPTGAIRKKWIATGKESGTLGYPIGEEECGRAGEGCVQAFHGGSVYWSEPSGANVIGTTGTVRDTWVAAGAETGPLGYPVGDERCGLLDDGCAQAFQGGSLFWSTASGAHVISPTGAIRKKWIATGKESGTLGYPIADERCGRTDAGCAQRFQHGSVYWSTATGAHVISPTGAIREAWIAARKERGALGYPTGDERCGLAAGGCAQTFRGGSLYTSPKGTFAVSGGILTYWTKAGAETGRLGYPIAAMTRTTTHETQEFEGGEVVRNRSTGRTITR